MTPQTDPAPKPAHRSLTLVGALAMAIAFVGERLGVQTSAGETAAVAQALLDLIFSLGLLGVGVGRARAKAPLA